MKETRLWILQQLKEEDEDDDQGGGEKNADKLTNVHCVQKNSIHVILIWKFDHKLDWIIVGNILP